MFGHAFTFLTSLTIGSLLAYGIFFGSIMVVIIAGMDDWKRKRTHSKR